MPQRFANDTERDLWRGKVAAALAAHKDAVQVARAASCDPPDPRYIAAVEARNRREVEVLRAKSRLAHVEAEAKR
mgnify:CR=1 FL=1